MKCIFLVPVVGFLFAFGKVFGVFQTSSAVDLWIVLAMLIGWFTFIVVNVPRTPKGSADSAEFSPQDHPYMLMV